MEDLHRGSQLFVDRSATRVEDLHRGSQLFVDRSVTRVEDLHRGSQLFVDQCDKGGGPSQRKPAVRRSQHDKKADDSGSSEVSRYATLLVWEDH